MQSLEIGHIHDCYLELQALLEVAGLAEADAIISVGVYEFIGTQEYYERTGEPCPLCTNPESFPVILPALRNTYKLLSGYQPGSLRPYQPQRVGVWIAPDIDADKWDAVDWPLSSPSVADLASLPADANGTPVAILTGSRAAAVETMFGQKINVCGMVVMNDLDIYRVFVRSDVFGQCAD
jgi:hypothetical protein